MTSPTSTSTPDAAQASVPPTAGSTTQTTPDASAHGSTDAPPPTPAGASHPGTSDAPGAAAGDAAAVTPRPARTRAHVRRLRRQQGDASREGGVGATLRTVAGTGRRGFDHARSGLASLVWTASLVAAGVLLLGVALVVVDANTRNALVAWILKAADVLDLGVFGRDTGVKQFTGEGAAVKNAVVNWGLGAVAWLVVGRLVRRLLTLGVR